MQEEELTDCDLFYNYLGLNRRGFFFFLSAAFVFFPEIYYVTQLQVNLNL